MSTRRLVGLGLVVSLLVAGVLSVYASSRPDGLESVAGTLGFDGTATASAATGSPLADYAVHGIGDPRLSGGLAGIVGALVVGLAMTGLVLLVRRRAASRTDGDD